MPENEKFSGVLPERNILKRKSLAIIPAVLMKRGTGKSYLPCVNKINPVSVERHGIDCGGNLDILIGFFDLFLDLLDDHVHSGNDHTGDLFDSTDNSLLDTFGNLRDTETEKQIELDLNAHPVVFPQLHGDGACLHAAIELAKREENAGKTIVALMPDCGDRYLSTKMFE